MTETVCVNFTGPALSFLLHENVKSKHEQEGFLLGDINVIVTKTITDLDSHNVKMQKVININSVIPCPRTCLFYNNTGEINKEELKNILGTQLENVVAWFKYEPDSTFRLTLKTKIIHKELCKFFTTVPPELFSYCSLSSKSNIASTHAYTHSFQRYHNEQFETVPLHINNLGESYNCYKPKAQTSNIFSNLCKSLGVQNTNISNWDVIERIQNKLQAEITNTVVLLSVSESRKGQLDREIQELRQQLEHQRNMIAEKALETENTQNQQKENTFISEMVLIVDLETNQFRPDISKKLLRDENHLENHQIDDNQSNSSDILDTSGDINLIDLTLTDDNLVEVEPKLNPNNKLSYAQVSTRNTKRKNK